MAETEDENVSKSLLKMNTFHRIVNSIEINIFSFFYAMLDIKDDSFFYYYAVVSINFIQVIGLSFNSNVYYFFQS